VKVSDCISKCHILMLKMAETGTYLSVAPTSYIGLAVCLISCGTWEVCLEGRHFGHVNFTK